MAIFLFSKQQDLEAEIERLVGESIAPLDLESMVPPADDLSQARARAIVEWVRQQVDQDGKRDVAKAGAATLSALEAALRTDRTRELREGRVWNSPTLDRLESALNWGKQEDGREFPTEEPLLNDDDLFDD